MKLFRTLLALLLALFLVVGCSTPTEETPEGEETVETDPGEETEEPTPDPEPEPANKDTLVVGTGGELNGNYISGFGNSNYDKWIRDLLYDYGTYATDEGGQFQLNTTVVDGEPEVTDNEDESRTYTFKIKEGLKYNTGEEITAKDYVFDVLFAASPEWARAGASTSAYDGLLGYAAYRAGETKVFSGVKLVDDMTFSVTINPENLPYFYEASYIMVGPSPMFRFAPGLDIGDDGQSLKLASGTELTDDQKAEYVKNLSQEIDLAKEAVEAHKAAWAETEAAATEDAPVTDEDKAANEEALKKLEDKVAALEAQLADFEAGNVEDAAGTLLLSGAYDIKNNYRFAPDVTSGPYQFVHLENQSALVELNPNYAGNFQGKKPTIQRVEVRNVADDLDVDMVINGEIDLTLGVIEGAKIEKAKANPDKAGLVDYKRNGYGLMAFHVDKEPVNHKEVRQALAYLMDRNEFVQQILGGYGEVGQGEYGLSQWMYVAKGKEFIEKITERDTVYNLDTDKANELLDKTPYTFEADGTTPWSKEKAAELAQSDGDNFNYWRHNAEGKSLSLVHAAGSAEVGNVIASQVTPNGRLAGLQFTLNNIDFNTLLDSYYNEGQVDPAQRAYHSYSLAAGFTPVFDPYYSYHSDVYGTWMNSNQVNDPEVDKIVMDMRLTDPEDTDGYAEKWLTFQLWFNDFLPNIPLYSNQYFDIHSTRLEGLQTTPDWDWTYDIVNLKLK